MDHDPEAVVARARALVGVRFRPQGRDPDLGLDCIGLAALALGMPARAVRCDYTMRGGCIDRVERSMAGFGLRRRGRPEAGDVVVIEAGAAQLHLGIWTGTGLVHADAGARRVVERPGIPPWPILSVWAPGEKGAE